MGKRSLNIETKKQQQTFLIFQDCRDHDGSIKNFGFSIKSSSTNVKLLNGALLDKTDLIVADEKSVLISI